MADRFYSEADTASAGRVFADYVDRLLAGELVDLDEVRRNHPELGAELLEQLRSFCEIAEESAHTDGPLRLGEFEIIREIGRGGMGIVYESVQISLGRRVALKVLPTGFSSDAKSVARFIREAQVSAKLDHPNVVTVFEMGIGQNVPYYAMEFVEGQTLRQELDQLRETNSEPAGTERMNGRYFLDLASCFAGVAEGLAHAHQRGVIHRDLKPSNLIFDSLEPIDGFPGGALRILDFGLARLDGQESLTAAGDVVGSIRYMSPEQAAASIGDPVDQRSDIYSLGATLYEALTLRPPHKGRDIQDTLRLIQSKEPLPPRRLYSRVPRDMETIVMKCLRKSPEDRYGTAEALGQDLARFVRGDPIEARPPSAWERATRWLERHRVQTVACLCFVTMVAIASLSSWKYHAAVHETRIAVYPSKVEQAAGKLRDVPISVIERTPHDLYLLPSGYKFYLGRTWIPPATPQDANLVRRAIEELNAAVALLPESSEAYWHRARAHLLNDDVAAARADLETLVGIAPEHVPGWMLRASVLDQSGEHGMAKESRVRGESFAQNGVYRDWWQAQQFAKRLHYKEAARCFQSVMESREEEPYTGWSQEVELALAICLRKEEAYVESLRRLRGSSQAVRLQEAITYYCAGGRAHC